MLRRALIVAIGGAICMMLMINISNITNAQEQTSPTAPTGEGAPKTAQPETKPTPTETKPPEPTPTQKPETTTGTDPKTQEEAGLSPAARSQQDELSNQSCLDCHNSEILQVSKEDLLDQVVVEDKPLPPRQRPPFIFGELNLSINQEKFNSSSHADTTCVTCHNDISELPHNQRLKNVDCKECHEEFVANVEASAHGPKTGKKSPGCIGCHDVHYGTGKEAYAQDFKRKLCVECHTAYQMDTAKGHAKLYEPGLHVALDCMHCHQGTEPGVHYIPPAKKMVAACDSCHQKFTSLSTEKPTPVDFISYIQQTGFINRGVLDKFGYVIGANRIPALDAIIILAVIAPLGLPVVHGGLRFITRRKGPIHLPEEKILLHPFIERIWHWFQALCIVILILSGIVIHWPEKFPGWFEWAVSVHNWFGMATVISFLVWLMYNLATKRITHYFPKKGEIPGGMIKQAKFYGYGIFKHEPHPYAPSEDNKFNPLQKIAYLQFQLLLMPLLLISGLLYMYPEALRGIVSALGGIVVIGTIHLILGALFAAFLMAHIYLATTGETVSENFKAMITGWGIKADDHGEHRA